MLRPVYKIKNLETLNENYYSLFGNFLLDLNIFLNRSGPTDNGC